MMATVPTFSLSIVAMPFTIGRSQVLLDDESAVVDGHVSIIKPKPGLDPVYLSLYLNTLPGQLQTERNWTGSSGQIEL